MRTPQTGMLVQVPGTIILLLCGAAFYFGRYSLSSSTVSSDPVAQVSVTVDDNAGNPHLRALRASGTKAELDPLDTASLERFFLDASGIEKIRPALPAAETGNNFISMIPKQILSWQPRIVVFPSFIDKARCEHIIHLANKSMGPVGLAFAPGSNAADSKEVRTSSGAYMSAGSDPDGVIAWLEERIAAVSLIPRDHGEGWNILRYNNMQHYDSHYDTFDPKDFGPQPNQRIVTVLVYLSEVTKGGETVFKREGINGGDRGIDDWRNCNTTEGAFMYKPRMGDAVMFWAVDPSVTIDPHALHGGCPVIEGEKWVATKWIRAKGSMRH